MKLMSMVEEIWKPVVGYEKYYEISNYGNCRSLSREIYYKSDSKNRKGLWKGKQLKPIKTEHGYLKYQFCVNSICKRFFAHRIVATAFLENKTNKRCVNHIDANRVNNMVDNLEWVTDSENVYHSYNHGNRDKKFYGICCVKKEIKLKKLISLKDFVLNYNPSKEQIFNYAKFLDNHLELGYFIVCDDEGNFFEEPRIEDYFDDGFNLEFNQKHFKDVVLKEYYKAKEKVLFEGFEVIKQDNITITIEYEHFQLDYNKILNVFANHRTIEDLAKYNLIELTENAIKQIGL